MEEKSNIEKHQMRAIGRAFFRVAGDASCDSPKELTQDESTAAEEIARSATRILKAAEQNKEPDKFDFD